MRLIGSKWKGPILYHLKDGPIRFNDLVRLLGGASKKMVGQRLKELESAGLILRKITSESPVAITYELTSFGRSTIDVLAHLKAWSEKYQIS
ncbi:UNVERIFIED_CONTAM: hypothetical protein GTU68_052169 [Idotea baltica]|nr:hypothetical protein [Idotea baltica]